jgi:hypothetical protein
MPLGCAHPAPQEVMNAYHCSALLVKLLMQQAEAAGVTLSVDTNTLENELLLKEISGLETAAAAKPASYYAKKPGLGGLGGALPKGPGQLGGAGQEQLQAEVSGGQHDILVTAGGHRRAGFIPDSLPAWMLLYCHCIPAEEGNDIRQSSWAGLQCVPCAVPCFVWRQVEALRGRLEALQGASNAALKDKASLTDQLAQAQQQLQARVKELAAAQQQIQQLKATAADAGKAASAAQQQAAAGAAAAAAKAGQQAAGLEQVAALQKQLKEKEAEVRR